jgi:2-oxoglutarate ferredoxin oxidoreductase subunit gamma
MRKEIVLAGFGGQGIILMGIILARLMEYYDELQVAQAQSYGPVARGGACRTDVVISDGPIHYPKCMRPDIMVFMSQESVKRYLPEGNPDETLILYDVTLIPAIDEKFQRSYPVPATGVAEKEMGNRLVANMFMLGALIDHVVHDGMENLEKVILASVPKGTGELNLRALRAGHAYAREHIPLFP